SPASLLQALDEGVAASLPFRIVRSQAAHQHADAPHALALLLRPRRERPRNRCAAEQRHELAPFHRPMPPVLRDPKDSTRRHARRLLGCGISVRAMTASGQLARCDRSHGMSASPPKATVANQNVIRRFVSKQTRRSTTGWLSLPIIELPRPRRRAPLY